MSLSYLTYETVDLTAVITISRESVYNALNKEAKAEIAERITFANNDSNIRSIVLTGEGRAFCTGQDLNDRAVTQTYDDIDLGHTLNTEWNPLMKIIRDSKKPVIAAVNGVAAGAGLSLVLSCDLIVAKEKCRFISGFSKLGLCPDAGSSFLLTKALGYQRSLDFFLNNETLFAEDLKECGLINYISADVRTQALELAEKINKLAPMSVQFIKQNLKLSLESSYDDVINAETDAQRKLGKSKDYQEGLKAFFEKRPPEFKGN